MQLGSPLRPENRRIKKQINREININTLYGDSAVIAVSAQVKSSVSALIPLNSCEGFCTTDSTLKADPSNLEVILFYSVLSGLNFRNMETVCTAQHHPVV